MTPDLLTSVQWEPVRHVATGSDLPYTTHSGVLDLLGQQLRVYRLNTGQAIVHQDDLHAFLAFMAGGASP